MSSQKRFIRFRPRGWLMVVPVALVLFLIYRLTGTMSADSLFVANAACQFALIVLGVIVAVKPQIGVQHPFLVIGLFVVLGGIGLIAAVRQQQLASRDAAEAQRQLVESNAKLSSSIEKAAEAAQEAIGASTGGESFCYLDMSLYWRAFAQHGKSPLYDVKATIINLRLYDPLNPPKKGETKKLTAARRSFSLGDMPVGSAWLIPQDQAIPIDTASPDRQDYQINYGARNGWWTQDVLRQKVGDRWLTATRVFREGPEADKIQGGLKKILIFTKIDKDFPGEPDWYPGKEALEKSRKLRDGTERFIRQPLPEQRP